MAHFAELDENNVVVRVLVVNNDVLETKRVLTTGEVITEDSQKGIDHLNDLFPDSGTWLQTSYNSNIRKNYAGKGFQYDPDLDAFIPPKVYPSWVLDTDKCIWVPPIDYPDSGSYEWNEETEAWDEVE